MGIKDLPPGPLGPLGPHTHLGLGPRGPIHHHTEHTPPPPSEGTMLFNPDPYNDAPHHPGPHPPLTISGGPPPLQPSPSFLAPPPSSSVSAPSPPSPPPPLCAGCRLRIVDKFYLCAVESKWHTSCLKCAECGVELENQVSCFERDGQMYCKDDYVRIFTSKCFRCLNKLSSQDLVMKVRQCLFHVDCFRCATCDATLKKGDLFGLVDDVPYCRNHYEHIMGAGGGPAVTVPPPPGSFSSDTISHHSPTGEDFHPRGAPDFGAGPPPGMFPQGFDPLQGPPPGWFGFGPPGAEGPGGEGFPPYDNNNEPRLKKQRGRKKRKVETTAFAAINGYMDANGGAFPPGADGPNGSKTKRARTSFKHHQLRIMKAHFQINQNPDSRELKMLSQKTQLDKKVLQVWFQNARAKWRRTKAQDGGSGGVSTSGAMLPGGPTTIPPAPTSSRGSEDGLDGLGGGPVSPCSDDVSTDMMPCC